MLAATIATLGTACILGCMLIPVGGWWLILAGGIIAVAALAYSAGPYPLSYHGLGDLTVWIFFGLAAVNLSYYVQTLTFDPDVFLCSAAMGLLSVNILIVNNYRDIDDDRAAGKHTTVVLFGIRPRSIFGKRYCRPFTGHEVLDCSRDRRLYTSSCLSDSTYQKLSGYGKMVRPGVKSGFGSNRP